MNEIQNGENKFYSKETKQKAAIFFQKEWGHLTELEKRVLHSIVEKRRISKNPAKILQDDRTFGERVADRVAAFGGSWTFIFIFAGILLSWIILNSYILAMRNETFDPYPYILLNLFLSMLAAIQAPVIMMSQNRQAAHDRLDAQHDYEINLKAEIEIANLHEKFDELREKVFQELLVMQKEQTALLNQIREQIVKT